VALVVVFVVAIATVNIYTSASRAGRKHLVVNDRRVASGIVVEDAL
jgi:hypothetical protein